MYTEFELRQLHLSIPRQRQTVEQFLQQNGLRIDSSINYYAGVFSLDGDTMVAGGGLDSAGVIKCVAVNEDVRDEGLSARLISHLISEAHQHGFDSVRLFTKPQNLQLFKSLGFHLLAEAPEAILMETGNGLQDYCRSIAAHDIIRSSLPAPHSSKSGVIVMNANPFTKGHQYLVEMAAKRVSHLFVMAVKEDRSLFSSQERLEMIKAGCRHLPNVTVVEGSDYTISATTFPTYFLKKLTDASDTQMLLDIDLFCRHIAPALGAEVRFVGTEPNDKLTCRYNELMQQHATIRVEVIPRLENDHQAISASTVRHYLAEGSFRKAAAIVPFTTLPYLIAHLATQALQTELDTTPKPGLVDCQDNGAHTDMDHQLMEKSIRALHPYFVQLAKATFNHEKTDVSSLQAIGLEAEDCMFKATNGVNTHKGALFSMGLAIVAASQQSKGEKLQESIKKLACQFPKTEGTHDQQAVERYSVKGALDNACEGYEQLFNDWLPFYQGIRQEQYACHKTLLRIMATLDDTNILHRTDAQTAQWVKQQAADALEHFSVERLQSMNRYFIERNISPGGSADMLSLTLFVYSIFN